MKNKKNTETRDRQKPTGNRRTPGYYYPEVVAYIERKRRVQPRICEVELAKCLRGNEIAEQITPSQVREILLGLGKAAPPVLKQTSDGRWETIL